MSGAPLKTRDLRSLTGSDFQQQGNLHLISDQSDSLADIVAIDRSGSAMNDPNESYELRDMVKLATTYFDRGMVDDAEELLNEAIAAGYTRTDSVELLQRVRAVRGYTALIGQQQGNDSVGQVASPPLQVFTIPLPGIETQTPLVRRAVDDGDRDLNAGRLESAQDVTLYALALAPTYLPLFVRLAELRQALGDPIGADDLTDSLIAVLDAIGEDGDWLAQSMRVTLDPSNTDALVQLAQTLLAQQGAAQLEPYVPNAIEQSLQDRSEVALELARAYLQLQPASQLAKRLHLRAVVHAGDAEQIQNLLLQDVTPEAPADLLFLRSCVAYGAGREEWFSWLEKAVARILTGSDDPAELVQAIDASRNLLPGPQHALAAAVVRVAANDLFGITTLLEPWLGKPTRETSNAQEMLVAACAHAFALRQTSAIESIEALAFAVSQAVVIDVRPFAEASRLFAHPISAEALMHELVAVVRETGQHEMAILHLQALRDRLPEHLEIRTGLADLQVAAGRTSEGVRELRYIAERYEQAGNFDRMVDAMRHISAAVPNNAEMKQKLIEGYVQRGVPEDAMRELRSLGDLYLKRGRAAEAAAAYTRGAEIASTTANYRRAMDLFERAVAADPDNVGVRHASVAHYIMSGAIEKATEHLRDIVRIALNDQDPDEAVAALHQIIGLAPSEASAYHKLGEVLTSLGEYAQAERVYRRLAAFTPDDPVLTAKQSALAALAAGH